MPLARAKRRGFALNCRFAVKGIQNASSSGFVAGAGVRRAFMALGPLGKAGGRQMIRKINTKLNFGAAFAKSVYYNRHYGYRCRQPLEGREADVRSVAA